MSFFLLHVLKNVYQTKKLLKKNRFEIKQIKEQKLREIIIFAYHNSIFYHDLYISKNIDPYNCRLEDLPIIDKKIVLNNLDKIFTDKRINKRVIESFLNQNQDPKSLLYNKYYIIHTSGSSGQVGYFVYNKKEFAKSVAVSTIYSPLKLGKKLAYVAAVKGHFAGVTIASSTMNLPLLYKDFLPIDINQSFSKTIQMLNQFQPTEISGYAFALEKLADAKKSGILKIKLNHIISGGESLLSEKREYIQSVFNCQVTNLYASSECLFMGYENNETEGMYLFDHLINLESNQNGTILTSLFNKTMPLIRYQLNDSIELIEDYKGILPFSKINSLVGRRENMPYFVNQNGEKDFIHYILIVEIYIKGLKQFQLKITGDQSFEFYVVLENQLTRSERHNSIKLVEEKWDLILKEKEMSNVKYTVLEVDELFVDKKTGKFKLII
jgi:phenylacetate-CoA ligase